MFTGLIRTLGTLSKKVQNNQIVELTIKNDQLIKDNLAIGDSVAVNGLCLTVTAMHDNGFVVQAVYETQARSNIDDWQPGLLLNLERPVTLQSYMDGHLVTGHVDGLAKIKNIEKKGEGNQIYLTIPTEISHYIASQGSVTLDGISLTVSEKATDDSCCVAIIPHTFNSTTAKNWKIGDSIHLEVDILARYVEVLMKKNKRSSLDQEFLAKHGF